MFKNFVERPIRTKRAKNSLCIFFLLPSRFSTLHSVSAWFLFKLHGNLVHFAAFKNHIGFYPTPTGTNKFKKELSIYEGAKGSVKFPLDKPIPFDLISKIVKFRVKENLARAAAKGKKK